MSVPFFKPELIVLEERINPSTLELVDPTWIRFTPGADAINELFISTTATTITIHSDGDPFSSIPDGWALSDGDHTATGPRGDITLIKCSDLGPEDDFLDGSNSDISLEFAGGLGDDILIGGSAADNLHGGRG